MTDINVDGVADQVLPLDRQASPEQIVAAASLVAELARRLNHATRQPLDLPTAGSVVGALHLTAQRMTQLCGQVGDGLRRSDGAPALRSDDRTDPQEHLWAAINGIDFTAAYFGDVAETLGSAHSAVNHLYLDGEEE